MPEFILSIREASRRLDVSNKVAGMLVRAHRIPTCKHPSNGLAKGLTPAAFDRLARAVEDWKAEPVSA